VSNLLASQITAAHPLAVVFVQVEQMPLGTVEQPASQPSAAKPLVSNLLASHEEIAVHTAVVQVEHMPLDATQPVHVLPVL
tara:strand:+ start:1302 stop:1544 length:243 start_codon:yes stop_codon:yes gene_type:complete